MNQIVIRTNAGEYRSGDTVYGTVYLFIVNPTAGCGVRLKFRGYERYVYGVSLQGDNSIPLHSEHKDYIDCNDIILYKSANPISLGSYVFPFQFSLLHAIPGSFHAVGQGDVKWEAKVEYWMQAEMIGAESVQVRESVLVLQNNPIVQQAEMTEHKVRSLLGLFHKNFFFTAKLLESEQRVLDYANLRLIIRNQSKRKVKSISIKLVRELILCVKSTSSFSVRDDPNVMRMGSKIWIQPETESLTVWERSLHDDQGTILNKGMDKVRIPLFVNSNQPIPSSTAGSHIQCRYKIIAVASLDNGQECDISLPIHSVLPPINKQTSNHEMNQIVIRTNAGEYRSGDTVYGTVYLFIVNPTAGCGVRLKFRGYERYVYGVSLQDDNSIPLHSEHKDYIDCNDIILYKSANPISLGSYVFPFQFSLLHAIPGSFHALGQGDVKWEAKVEYWMQAEMIGAESVQVRESVLVLQNNPIVQQAEMTEHKVRSLLGLFHKNFFFTAKLLESEQRVLDYANLRLIIRNQSKKKVKSISIKLVRELILCVKSTSSFSVRDDPNVMRMGSKIWIQPETESLTVWERSLHDDQGTILNKGMDKVRIPLFVNSNQPIPSSTAGSHIQCRYKIIAVASLDNGQECDISLPVHSVLPPINKQWLNWDVPDWINSKLTVMPTHSPFDVPKHLLKGEAFAGLPPFHQF